MNTFSITTIFLVGMICSCTHARKEMSQNEVSEVITQEDAVPVEVREGGNQLAVGVDNIVELPIEKVFELQQSDSILLVDTRPPIFYQLGHIDGAISLPIKSFDASFGKSKNLLDNAVREGKKIVIYCQSETCPSSQQMARKFSALGYSSSIFKGGWELWKVSGL